MSRLRITLPQPALLCVEGMGANKNLPDHVKQEIRAERAKGRSGFDLSLDYDLSISMILRMTKDLGVKAPSGRYDADKIKLAKKLHASGLSRGLIQQRTGFSYSFLRKYLGHVYVKGARKDSHNDCAISA